MRPRKHGRTKVKIHCTKVNTFFFFKHYTFTIKKTKKCACEEKIHTMLLCHILLDDFKFIHVFFIIIIKK